MPKKGSGQVYVDPSPGAGWILPWMKGSWCWSWAISLTIMTAPHLFFNLLVQATTLPFGQGSSFWRSLDGLHGAHGELVDGLVVGQQHDSPIGDNRPGLTVPFFLMRKAWGRPCSIPLNKLQASLPWWTWVPEPGVGPSWSTILSGMLWQGTSPNTPSRKWFPPVGVQILDAREEEVDLRHLH